MSRLIPARRVGGLGPALLLAACATTGPSAEPSNCEVRARPGGARYQCGALSGVVVGVKGNGLEAIARYLEYLEDSLQGRGRIVSRPVRLDGPLSGRTFEVAVRDNDTSAGDEGAPPHKRSFAFVLDEQGGQATVVSCRGGNDTPADVQTCAAIVERVAYAEMTPEAATPVVSAPPTLLGTAVNVPEGCTLKQLPGAATELRCAGGRMLWLQFDERLNLTAIDRIAGGLVSKLEVVQDKRSTCYVQGLIGGCAQIEARSTGPGANAFIVGAAEQGGKMTVVQCAFSSLNGPPAPCRALFRWAPEEDAPTPPEPEDPKVEAPETTPAP